jgi:hypothetical protein
MSIPSSLPKFSVNDPILVYSSDDDNGDENPLLLAHLPLVGSIEHEPTTMPHLSIWVHTT